MLLELIPRLVVGRTDFEIHAWIVVAFGIAAAVLFGLQLEKNQYVKRVNYKSWLRLRILSVVLLVITIGIIVIPTSLVSGPAALAVMYGLSLFVGPAFWFVSHYSIGRLLVPSLGSAESVTVAILGLAYLFGPAVVIAAVSMPIQLVAKQKEQRFLSTAKDALLQVELSPMRHFRFEDTQEIQALSARLPRNIQLRRVEQQLNTSWIDTTVVPSLSFCRQENSFHFVWPAVTSPPALRVYWTDASKTLFKSEFNVPAAKAGAVEKFSINWTHTDLSLPVPVPYRSLQIGFSAPAEYQPTTSLAELVPGKFRQNDCAFQQIVALNSDTHGHISAVVLVLQTADLSKTFQLKSIRDLTASK